MAVKKKSLSKAFISIGKVIKKGEDGKSKAYDAHIVISEDLAKFIGAKYSTVPPAPRKIEVKRGGQTRTITREYSVKLTGEIYYLGYVNGTKTNAAGKKKVNIRWVPIHISKDLKLREFLKVIRDKFTKKPVYLKMPSGVTTRFVQNK